MEILIVFIRHYLFCFIGGLFRYLFTNLLNLIKKKPIISFSFMWNYKLSPKNELGDAMIGFFVLAIFLSLLF